MKILILGAKGMLGQELARVFRGDNTALWDLDEIDVADEARTREGITALRPEIIINAAAYNAVDKAEEEAKRASLINGYAPGHLARIANDIGAILIHYSTDYVFDGENRNGYSESDAPNPISAYGASKLLGEIEVKKNTKKYYIVRLSRLFGQAGGGKKSFVGAMLSLAREKEEIKVIDEEISSPTYAPDLAERTKYILENGLPFGIYHSANAGACTWYEFAEEIFKIKGVKINLIKASADDFPRPAKRPKYSVLLNTKLPPMRDWREALGEFLNQKF